MNKQYIIDEIKRTAKENGGIPLGRERFATHAGIKESDWHGRFWVRWGDAIQDAGFLPNRLRTAYAADELIAKFVLFARELGRFPVAAELKMKAAHDKNFPSHNVWRTHFGGKNDFAKRVLDYCSTRSCLADVAAMCPAMANTDPDPSDFEKRTDERDESFGFVYLIRSGKHYKIGQSKSVGRRQYELAIQLPEKVQKVHDIRTDDPVGIEAYWHNRFAAKRKNGEWFELAAADIVAFKRRKFM